MSERSLELCLLSGFWLVFVVAALMRSEFLLGICGGVCLTRLLQQTLTGYRPLSGGDR
jgi:hypothetical protein